VKPLLCTDIESVEKVLPYMDVKPLSGFLQFWLSARQKVQNTGPKISSFATRNVGKTATWAVRALFSAQSMSGLSEYKVGHFAFEIEVDYRDSGEVEGRVRAHRHKEPPSDSKDGPENQPCDTGLFRAGEPLFRIME